jgi:hypothetical protein
VRRGERRELINHLRHASKSLSTGSMRTFPVLHTAKVVHLLFGCRSHYQNYKHSEATRGTVAI